MVIKHIIFDLGGVLFHWNPKQVLEILQIENPLFPKDICEMTFSKTWLDFDAGLIQLKETIDILARSYPRLHLERFIELSLEKLVPIEPGVELLRNVQERGYKTFILSNISQEFLNRISNDHFFLKTFDGAVFSYQIQAIKPQEKIYRALLEKYHLKPEECLFIDDTLVNLEAAERIGIQVLHCKNPHRLAEELKNLNLLIF